MFPIFAGNSASTGYNLTRSLRFRASASGYLSRTMTTPTNNLKWTWSGWIKRGVLGTTYSIFGSAPSSTTYSYLYFDPSNYLIFEQYASSSLVTRLTTSQVFRDPSAWYHIVLVYDSANATSTNRVLMYVNGVQVTAFSVTTYPSLSLASQINAANVTGIGSLPASYTVIPFDGYLAEVNFIDGQALTPSSFGSTNALTGVWQPARYTGTYGTNGFYLPFTDNSALTTSSNVGLGKDFSGNGNYWTTNNISITAGVTYDSMTDVPTLTSATASNFAVLNPLNPSRSTLTNGNLTASGTTDTPTIIPTSGTYYFEIDGVSKSWTPPAAFPAAAGNYNFGQRPFTNTPTGTLLNTFNLPTSTIVKGNTVFDATLYTGTGASLSVTNAASFKPDLVWVKGRSGATDHALYDSVRGVQKQLESNTTTAETTETTGLTAFGSAGFTVGALAQMNTSAATYVGWQWQAGQGSSSSNTNGTITSTVSVNASAGFSVVTWTANGSANQTIGHGLGVTPSLVIVKHRNDADNWAVWITGFSSSQFLRLNTTDSTATSAGFWNATPTSSVFSVGSTGTSINVSGGTYVAYCWTPIAGFSAFGSYTGNGSTDGPFVYTGFRPRWIMIKRSDSAGNNWRIWDTARATYNAGLLALFPNVSDAEDSVTDTYDLVSNGFKLRTSGAGTNASGGTYIYAAFAENPTKYALAR